MSKGNNTFENNLYSPLDTIISSKEYVYAKHISGGNLKWRLRLIGVDCKLEDISNIVFVNASGRKCKCPIVNREKNGQGESIYVVDLSPLKDTVENCKVENWKAFVYGRSLHDISRISDEPKTRKDPFRIRLESMEKPVGSFEFEGRKIELVPFCDSEGKWTINVADVCLRYMPAFKCIGIDAGFRRNEAFFKVACPTLKDFRPKGIMVCFKYQFEKDRQDYFFPVRSIQKYNNHLITLTKIKLDEIDFQPLFWDIRMVFENGEEDFWCNIKSPCLSRRASKSGNYRAKLKSLIRKQTIRSPKGLFLSVSETPYNNCTIMVQQESPYSGLVFRLKEWFALALYGLMKHGLKRKKIYLVHEKYCSTAQDNGFFFFKYCMENGIEQDMQCSIFYVIDKSSPDYTKLEPYKDHVIQFMSLRHMIYVLATRLIISSECKLHSYAWRSSESIIRQRVLNNKKLVFLQHGVIGLKRVDAFKKGLPADSDMFITSNDMEREFIINELYYPPKEVVVTGLSRWDVLEDKSMDTEKMTLLIMPTWRKWLDGTTDEGFLESEYYHKYMELINSAELEAILIKYKLNLDFYIHPKLSELIRQFSTISDRIRLIPFGSEPLNELMMECRMLITDYSSVCWDVYYMGKPVLFYQFDLAEYNESQGAYMDLEKDLFGDRAETKDKLLTLIEEAVQSGFELKPKYAKMREGMYKYIDHDNSKRICEEIKKRGW